MTINILILVVALQHFWILYLEMFLWTRPIGKKIFHMSETQAQNTKVLAANQGLYNGFLAAGLIWAVFHPDAFFSKQLSTFFLICILIAALYGGYSVNKRILWIQGLPALVALTATFLL